MSDSSDWTLLLDRYIAGECSAAEEIEIGRGLAERGELCSAVEALRAARARSPKPPTQLPDSTVSADATLAAFGRLEQRLADRGTGPGPRPQLVRDALPVADTAGQRRAALRRAIWRVPAPGAWAAGLAVACAVGALTSWLALGRLSPTPQARTPAYREYVTARGERAEMRLLDGTRVTLNVDSRIRIPTTFGAGAREVTLVGEAYFAVVHDAARPFTVRTGRGVTRDVGTHFDVRAYGGDPVERVAVAEGSVAVGSTPLGAGDVAVLADSSHVRVAHGANVDRATAWTRGRLEFANEPLTVALGELARWYDLDVQLADPALGALRISGSYGDEPLSQVLALVTAAAGARYEQLGHTVIVRAVR